MLKAMFYIWIGGGLGSVLRFGVQWIANRFIPIPFPLGTFLVNVIGCFCIGFFYALSQEGSLSVSWRLFLITGLCGGFTTFSSFSYEGLKLLQDGHYFNFTAYTLLSVALGLIATWVGFTLFR